MNRPIQNGAEGMVGEIGEVIENSDGEHAVATCRHCRAPFMAEAAEIVLSHEGTLREMVELKCGTVAMQTAPETVLRTPPSQHSGKSVL